MPLEVSRETRLGFDRLARSEQLRAEQVPRREDHVARLVVGELCLRLRPHRSAAGWLLRDFPGRWRCAPAPSTDRPHTAALRRCFPASRRPELGRSASAVSANAALASSILPVAARAVARDWRIADGRAGKFGWAPPPSACRPTCRTLCSRRRGSSRPNRSRASRAAAVGICSRAFLSAVIVSARRPSIPAALAEELEIVDQVHRVIIGRRGLLEIGEIRGRALAVRFAASSYRPTRCRMCAGMCSRWPAAGIIPLSTSADATAARGAARLRRRGCNNGWRPDVSDCASALVAARPGFAGCLGSVSHPRSTLPGFVFISPSAYIVCTSSSFGYFAATAASLRHRRRAEACCSRDQLRRSRDSAWRLQRSARARLASPDAVRLRLSHGFPADARRAPSSSSAYCNWGRV